MGEGFKKRACGICKEPGKVVDGGRGCGDIALGLSFGIEWDIIWVFVVL